MEAAGEVEDGWGSTRRRDTTHHIELVSGPKVIVYYDIYWISTISMSSTTLQPYDIYGNYNIYGTYNFTTVFLQNLYTIYDIYGFYASMEISRICWCRVSLISKGCLKTTEGDEIQEDRWYWLFKSITS